MTLGIPANVVMALLLGALMIHGLTPGPMLMIKQPDLFWGVICSMYIGNIMLLILNLPLIGLWVKVLRIPYRILFPLILLFCLIGAYSVNNNAFDVCLMIFFGVVGYSCANSNSRPPPSWRTGPGTDDGEFLPPIPDHVRRRLFDFRDPADSCGYFCDRRHSADHADVHQDAAGKDRNFEG